MNIVTRDIAAWLGVSLDEALRIQEWISGSGFDFSECSNEELKREAIDAKKFLDGKDIT